MDEHALRFGTYLRKLRISIGYRSQTSFAKETGISQTTISRNEIGQQVPTVQTLVQFSNVLNIPVEELLYQAGYWDSQNLNYQESLINNDLNEPKNNRNYYESVKKQRLKEDKTIISKSQQDNSLFVHLPLDDKHIREICQLTVDGQAISEREWDGMISYIRALREIDS